MAEPISTSRTKPIPSGAEYRVGRVVAAFDFSELKGKVVSANFTFYAHNNNGANSQTLYFKVFKNYRNPSSSWSAKNPGYQADTNYTPLVASNYGNYFTNPLVTNKSKSFDNGGRKWLSIDFSPSDFTTTKASDWNGDIYVTVVAKDTSNLYYWSGYNGVGSCSLTIVTENAGSYVKYYNGTDWQNCETRYYDGEKWVECEIKYYDGEKWVGVDVT